MVTKSGPKCQKKSSNCGVQYCGLPMSLDANSSEIERQRLRPIQMVGSFDAEGVCPVYCEDNARESALSFARQPRGLRRLRYSGASRVGETIQRRNGRNGHRKIKKESSGYI